VKLATLFKEHTILINMDPCPLEGAISALVDTVEDGLGGLDKGEVCKALLETESALPMPPGHGIRIPHARLAGLENILMALATSREGFLAGPEDEERVHLVFLILAPKAATSTILQAMASIARLTHSAESRKALVSTTSPVRLLRILEETGIDVRKAVVAADLMNPIDYAAAPGMTLREGVDKLAASHEEGVPVLDGGLAG